MLRFRRTLAAAAALLLLLPGCRSTAAPSVSPTPAASAADPAAPQPLTFTDALGYEVTLHSWERVVSLYGSFAETWTLAGGTLLGTTQDAVSERHMELGPDVAVVGTVKEPNLEEVLALAPDFVILSGDSAAQTALHESLCEANVPHAYYVVDRFEDYLAMLQQFCEMTGRSDLYEAYGTAVAQQVQAVRDLVAQQAPQGPSALLLRAYATGCKAKGQDNLTGVMLADLGAQNIVEAHESLLEDLSMEEILAADPETIFITTMGADEQKALDWVAQNLEADPAWAGLAAVQNGRCHVLPKELFHYKPNARWAESYRTLAALLYPELDAQLAALAP